MNAGEAVTAVLVAAPAHQHRRPGESRRGPTALGAAQAAVQLVGLVYAMVGCLSWVYVLARTEDPARMPLLWTAIGLAASGIGVLVAVWILARR